ncbi:MAG: phosphoribosyl-ATP diphosphatase [Oscillospiraceae bacterium]|nr:phosphoribosyl-ATP diphosphatase [Oscillospiraceae bacterium]MDD4413566.1 phosphoribosyl-ATP diphosphatase [Oscillospiraceae bacterium]
MNDCIQDVYDTIIDRRDNPSENSYTRYLFDKGIDKILKKVGEETSEVLIAAKNGNNHDTVGEIADLTYHLLVLMAQQGIKPQDVADVLNERHKTSGNLKRFNKTDKNT